MSRSVSRHKNAYVTVYLNHPFGEGEEEESWDYFIEDLQQVLDGSACDGGFPSLIPCDRWSGREDHVILENQRGEVSISEYNGLVAICLAPRDPDNALDVGWCDTVAKSFRALLHKAYKHCALSSMGRFSNGEQAFQPIDRPEGLVTSKEGTLW